ncbi:MAG: DUF1016 family protein [Bacteroidetes bacterium]|nr:DUF1016 family protein [Bacteroidota bacterium]
MKIRLNKSSGISLFKDIKHLIGSSRKEAAIAINSTITTFYWHIGKHVKDEILKNQRAEHGKEIIINLSESLTKEYGKGWGEKQIRHCVKFSESFPNIEIVYTLCIQLSWSHIRILTFISDDLRRSFYTEMCKIERWSTRQLQERVNSMMYERTIISKKPKKLIQDELRKTPMEKKINPEFIFKDPYVLDFLGLKDVYSEKDLEESIIVALQKFIIELGADFAFMARQKRLTIDNQDYFIDLLFYHRSLRCLIVIDLKLGKFEASHKGQMELYLRWLEKYDKHEWENSPVGLILCAGKSNEQIELLQLDKSNIKVAEYLTTTPEIKQLQNKLNNIFEYTRKVMAVK